MTTSKKYRTQIHTRNNKIKAKRYIFLPVSDNDVEESCFFLCRVKIRNKRFLIFPNFITHFLNLTQSAFTCSKLKIETLEQGVKYVKGNMFH